ncbi:MAG: hypothetical protein JNJ45_03985 [Chthonomonas sp.]|nr:hypothetical protein [Chthonomonas sp.]
MVFKGALVACSLLAGLASASASLVFVLDSNSRSIFRFDAETGEYKGIFGNGFFSSSAPVSMAQSSKDGLLYVGRADGLVLRFDPYTGQYLGPLASGFNGSLVGLAMATDGTLYCANSGASALILRFDGATGQYLGPLGQWNVQTGGQNTYVDGNNYFCTNTSGQIVKLDRVTGQLLSITTPPAPSAPRVMNDLGNTNIGYASDASGGIQAGVLRVNQQFQYQGPIAPNWFGAIRDIEAMPDGRVLVAASVINAGSQYVIGRFDRVTGQYGGLLAANWGFNIVDMETETPISINGTLTFGNYSGVNRPATVRIYEGGTNNLLQTTTLPNQPPSGAYSLSTIYRGNLDLYFEGSHWLRRKVSVNVPTAGLNGVNATLINGNAVFDDFIDVADYSALAAAFDAIPSSGNWNAQADFNGDDIIDIADYTILAANFDIVGDALP